MNYEYINMAPNQSYNVVVGGKGKSNRPGLITVKKLEIVNLDSSAITVDVYIERIDIVNTEKLHGTKKAGNTLGESANINAYANKVSDIYYKVKGVVVPAGVTLSLFTDHPCTHSDEFDLNVAVAESASVDLFADWEYVVQRRATSGRSVAKPSNY